MVAVVRRPAQRQLGEVARTDDKTAVLVRKVHEHLRALACLRVLVGYVAFFGVMADIGKVQPHRFPDRHLPEGRAEQLGKLLRVRLRAPRRTEARHRDGKNPLARQAQAVKGAGADEQSQRRVQSAGHAHHHMGSVRARQPRFQPGSLQIENHLTARGQIRFALRNKRRRIDAAMQAERGGGQREGNRAGSGVFAALPCCDAAALARHAGEIEIGLRQTRGERLGLRENRAVFRQ